MNNKCKKAILLIVFIASATTLLILVPIMVSPLSLVYAQNSATGIVNATVKINSISICGNTIVESGEDCESGNLQSKTCSNLGYSSGNLSCDISCSFDTSSCTAPTINPDNVPPDSMSSLLPAGYFNIPQTASVISTPSLTATSQVTFNIPMNNGTGSVVLPKDLVITRTDGANLDPTALTTSNVTTSSLSGFSQSVTVDGALQWGISTTTLEFSIPITLSIYAGTSLNGQTLNIVRSTSEDSGWTSDGIVAPATCTVSAGLCTFQATKASYFATNRTASSSSSSSSSSSTSSSAGSSSSSTSTSSNPTSTPIPAVGQPLVSLLPAFLKIFDANGNGKIESDELYGAVSMWIDEWKEFLTEEIADTDRCDFNNDGECNIKDLSILLFYVEK